MQSTMATGTNVNSGRQREFIVLLFKMRSAVQFFWDQVVKRQVCGAMA